DQGTGCRFLAVAVAFTGRGDRMGQALPESVRTWRVGTGDPPGIRGRGFRRGVHAGTARTGRTAAGRNGRARAETLTVSGRATHTLTHSKTRHSNEDMTCN